MKKLYIYLFAAVALGMASCNEYDSLFEESAAQRYNKAEAKYTELLTSAPYGWAFEYYPTNSADDGALLYALNFKKDGTVVVAGDPSQEHAIQSETSLWDIIMDQGPVLSFSTYNNLIHMWSNPNTDGKGYEGDYEFCFVTDPTEDPNRVIVLRGKKRGLKCRLQMIEEDQTPAEYLLECDSMMQAHFPSSQKNYSVLHIGDMEYRLDLMNSAVPTYYPMGTDPTFTGKTNTYILAKYYGKYEMRFNKTFYNSDSTIAEKNFIYNPVTMEFAGKSSSARITPPDYPTLVTRDLMNADLTSLRLTKNSEMGDKTKELWTAIEASLKKKNNTLNESLLSTKFSSSDDANCSISLTYKPKTGAASSVYYLFNIEKQGDKVVLSYVRPANTGAENVLKNFPEAEPYIKGFEGTYKLENPNPNSKFTVATLRFTNVQDASIKFSMNATFPTPTTAN